MDTVKITPEYIPYGEEWVKEMKRLPKEFLIGMIKDLNLARKEMEKLPPLREVVIVDAAMVQSIKRGMAEYFMQHNYRELYGMFTEIILPILEQTVTVPPTAQEHDKEVASKAWDKAVKWRNGIESHGAVGNPYPDKETYLSTHFKD